MIRVGPKTEAVSGVLAFVAGVLLLFFAVQFALYMHAAADAVVVAVLGVWSIALIGTSRRAGSGIVIFRICSLALIVCGSIISSVILGPLH